MLRVIEKSWKEFWAYYWRVDDRHRIPGIFDWDRRLVAFIEYTCRLKPPGRILDLACGGGDQAKIFAEKGYEVVGIDIAPSLIEYAKKQFREAGVRGSFITGDMREIDYNKEFDVCVILSGSFGFFGYAEDLKLLCAIRSALKQSGRTFIMFLSATHPPKSSHTWREISDGWELNETWFDAETSTRCGKAFIIRKDGTIVKPKRESGYCADERIQCYTILEMRKMLSEAGLEYVSCYSDRHLDVPPQPRSKDAVINIVVGERRAAR